MKPAAVVLACLLAAGCASTDAARSARSARSSAVALSGVVPTTQGYVSPAASSTSSPPATLESNNAAAAGEAAALVELAQVPPGAQQLVAAPGVGAGADAGISVPWLLDRTQYWQVPMDFDTTVAWETSHPPAGIGSSGARSGSGSGPGPSDRNVDFDYFPPSTSPAWTDARLEIEVKSGTSTVTNVRVESTVGAIDPTPFPDLDTDPRLRVTVGGGCPGSDTGGTIQVNAGSDLATSILPTAAPTSGLLCEYRDGYSSTGAELHGLIKAIPLDAGTSAKIAEEIALVPLGGVDGEMRSCPPSFGEFVLAVSDAGRSDTDVWSNISGCPWIRNSRIAASGDLASIVQGTLGPSLQSAHAPVGAQG